MRRVIVNSTPLIALCNAGLLKLLKEIYGTITIPRAVFDEVTAKQDSACTQIKDNLDWITVEEIKDIAIIICLALVITMLPLSERPFQVLCKR